MTRIVTSTYRYKRPPRKRKAVALDVPAIVKAADPANLPELHSVPRTKQRRRRGAGADAMFREMKRQIAAEKG
jgi:hypothetical protein